MQFGGSVLNLERRNEVNNRLGCVECFAWKGACVDGLSEFQRYLRKCQVCGRLFLCLWVTAVCWVTSLTRQGSLQATSCCEGTLVSAVRTSSPQSQLLWNSSCVRQCTVGSPDSRFGHLPCIFYPKTIMKHRFGCIYYFIRIWLCRIVSLWVS